jgi:hypothetical protein
MLNSDLAIAKFISYPIIMANLKKQGSADGMGFGIYLTTEMAAQNLLPYILIMVRCIILGRIGLSIYRDRLQILNIVPK